MKTAAPHKKPHTVPEAKIKPSGKDKSQPFSYFAVLFFLLMQAMEVRQGSVLTQSKVLQANSQAQNELNKENGNIKFSILPPNAKNPTINRVQEENQDKASERENIQNNLITCRQTAQVEMTQASTNVDILQQDASENSGWLKMLNTIFQVIDELTKR